MTFYVGVDLHARSVQVSVLDEQGAVVSERSLPSIPDDVLKFLERFRPDCKVAVESMGSHYWLVDALEEAGYEFQLAHPLMVKAIAYAKVKTDKADARTIAGLLRLGMLPRAYNYPKALRALRDLSRKRSMLVEERALHYRDLQYLHQQMALGTPSRNAVKKITALELEERFAAAPTRMYATGVLEINAALTTQIDKIEKYLHQECRENISYTRLMQIPGVGETYGHQILLESGDVTRFPTHRQYVSYARLVPGSSNSGEKVRTGGNSKQGNAKLKNAFRQVALRAVMCDRAVKGFFDRKLKVVHRKNIAYAIVARKMAIAAYLVLKGENVELGRLFGGGVLARTE